MISLRRQTSMLVTSILEAHMHEQTTLEIVQPIQAADDAASFVRHSLCTMIGSNNVGDCKLHALASLLGYKRVWVAAFGVAAAVACWAHLPSSSTEQIIVHYMSPWQDMAYEMWHMCRYVVMDASRRGVCCSPHHNQPGKCAFHAGIFSNTVTQSLTPNFPKLSCSSCRAYAVSSRLRECGKMAAHCGVAHPKTAYLKGQLHKCFRL